MQHSFDQYDIDQLAHELALMTEQRDQARKLAQRWEKQWKEDSQILEDQIDSWMDEVNEEKARADRAEHEQGIVKELHLEEMTKSANLTDSINRVIEANHHWTSELKKEQEAHRETRLKSNLSLHAAEMYRATAQKAENDLNRANLDKITLDDEIERLKHKCNDLIRAMKNGQTQRKPDTFKMPKTRAEAFRLLDLNCTANRNEIKRRYREMSAQHHPDKGGLTENFQAVQEAYNLIK